MSSSSSRFIPVILIVFAALTLAVLPVRVQFVPNEAAAEETPVEVSHTAHASQPESVLVQNTQAGPNVIEYTLRTAIGGTPAMAYIGVGGEIDGVANPDLHATVGDTVRITVINGDPMLHDLRIEEFGVYTGELLQDEQTVVVEFVANQAGTFVYFCSIPGHRQVGMEGKLIVSGEAAESTDAENVNQSFTVPQIPAPGPAAEDAVSIIRNPADVPAPIGDREPQTHQITMDTVELNGILADGTTYRYMTFDGQVPGPMLRVRVGDTVELTINNPADSHLAHSIDLHAVTGPGGGAVYTQTLPGGSTSFTFKALNPGLYVYHCATPSVAHHITSGMYGLILVEPEGGLPPVDREFYVMQGEMYTAQPFGTEGHLDFSHDAMLDEDAEYFVFNGSANALTQEEYALRAEVGETVRIYFGVGGPNKISSFHVIGEIFDRVYDQASLTSEPLTNVQTTLVPSGGATVVEFTVDVPGSFLLVDHALSRAERGLAGHLIVTGEEDPTVFHSEGEMDTTGH